MMKTKDKGITLIALIITIIVMIILIMVTLNILLGDNGVIIKSKEAAFKKDISQIKDLLEIEKAEYIIESKGKTLETFEISLNDLGLGDKLLEKYETKLVIQKDGNLYYIKSNVTNQEIIWLEQMGIYETSDRTAGVRAIAEANKIGDFYNLQQIMDSILEEYPGAAIFMVVENYYTNPDILRLLPVSVNDLDTTIFEIENEIRPIIEEKSLDDSVKLQDVPEILAILEKYNKTAEYGNKSIDSFEYFLFVSSNISLLVANEGDEVIINAKNGYKDNNASGVTMEKETFDTLFTYTSTADSVTITGYIGSEENLVIPDAIYDENGNKWWITAIGDNAFAGASASNAVKVKLSEMIPGFSEMTVKDFYSAIIEGTYTGGNGDSTSIELKNQIFIEQALKQGFYEYDFEIVGEGNSQVVYIYVDPEKGEITHKPIERTMIKTLKSRATELQSIGEGAFSGNTVLTQVTLYLSSVMDTTMPNNVFTGCTNLTSIYINAIEDSQRTTGIYQYDNVKWGAPNAEINWGGI